MRTKDLLDQLGFQRIINAAGHYTYLGGSILAEMPKKVRELAELLGMEPDLFPKSVPS